MPPRTLVIVNPGSANGATRRRLRRLERSVRQALADAEIEHTRGPRDAERLAREAVRAGFDRLVVAGGDGTLAEVASGLLGAHLGAYAEIGLLPLGTGNDFARSLGVPRDTDAALALLRTGSARRVDAGRLRCRGRDGAERTAYFANEASLGVSALIDELTSRIPKLLGGTVAFGLGAVRGILRYRCASVALRVDGEPFADEPLVLAAAANGRYFGGGMCVAPEARLDDGLLDVVAVRGLSAGRLLAKLPKLYRGTHVADAAVRCGRGRVIEAEAAAGEVCVELDGEPLGTLPARIEVLPGALAVIGPKA